MGFWDKGIGYLKDKTNELDDVSKYQKALLKTFSFTSIGGGSGSSTVILYLAQQLALEEKKQVVILDLNFLEPDILYNLNVDVTSENSVLKYIKGEKNLNDCFVQDNKIKNLHLITASPKDSVVLLNNIKTDRDIIGNLIHELDAFDYILINLPFEKTFITFMEPLKIIDRGFIVIDERLSNLNKVTLFLDFIHKFQGVSNTFSNVILNKRGSYDYPYEKIEEVKCNLLTELPYDSSIQNLCNFKSILYKEINNKDFQTNMINVIESLKK